MIRTSIVAINVRWRQFRGSTLLMNSVFLMLATIAVAASGFVFWVIVTRSYDTRTVGLAATLLSLSGLLSMLSLAGFDTTLVRFLPGSERKSDQINSGLMIVALTGAVLSIGFVLSFPFTAPSLAFVLHNTWYFVGFVFFTIVTSLNVLTNAVFLALKRAWDIFIINILFSALKVALPLLIMNGSAMTIFVFVGLSQLAGLILSLVIIRAELRYVFSPKVHLDILRVIKKYSFSVYAASILNLLPPTLLPLLIVHRLGAENAAYYYMAFTIASVLYTICYATMQSAFAEGSHNEAAMGAHVAKAARLIGALLVPAMLLTIGLSHLILKIFGSEYSAQGSTLLQLFAISAVAVAIYSALGAIFKVTRNLSGVVAMNVVYAVVILGISYLLIPHFGVIAIGWAWMLGNIAAAITGLVFLKKVSHKLT
jgi:O-antigen/teichoic acid export membrane protein